MRNEDGGVSEPSPCTSADRAGMGRILMRCISGWDVCLVMSCAEQRSCVFFLRGGGCVMMRREYLPLFRGVCTC